MAARRSKDASEIDLELAALEDLRRRVQALRKRVFTPVAAGTLIAGPAGVIAHLFGYWSVFGSSSSGYYGISRATVLVALVVPPLPILSVGVLVYKALSARLRVAWCEAYEGKIGLTRAMLERNAARYG